MRRHPPPPFEDCNTIKDAKLQNGVNNVIYSQDISSVSEGKTLLSVARDQEPCGRLLNDNENFVFLWNVLMTLSKHFVEPTKVPYSKLEHPGTR